MSQKITIKIPDAIINLFNVLFVLSFFICFCYGIVLVAKLSGTKEQDGRYVQTWQVKTYCPKCNNRCLRQADFCEHCGEYPITPVQKVVRLTWDGPWWMVPFHPEITEVKE